MWGVTIALLVVAVGLWFRWRRKLFSTFKELGIPGPEPSLFFGNLWEMTYETPLKCHQKWIEKYGKVVGYYFGRTPTLLVTDLELMKKILIGDFHKFANRPQLFRSISPKKKAKDSFSDQLTSLKDKRWKEIRSIITPSFTTSKMRMMLPIMDSAVDSLLDIMEKKTKMGKSFDIYELYKGLTMDVIGRTAFGIQTDCQNNPDDIIMKATRMVFSGQLKNVFLILILSFPELGVIWKIIGKIRLFLKHGGRHPFVDLRHIVENVIKVRRENKKNSRQDLLQIMIDAAVTESDLNKITDDELTANDDENEDLNKDLAPKSTKSLRYMLDNEIADNSILFLLAGFETTSTALAFTTHFLLYYPEIQERIREDIKAVVERRGKLDYDSVQQLQYLDQVISEAMRIYPPIYLFVSREVNEDVKYGQYKIKKGWTIQIPVYNIHHDPNLWIEPEKFDPDRFSPENKAKQNSLAYQPFGAGPRNCVGMRFAQLEAKLALARILSKYKLVRAEDTDNEQIELRITISNLNPEKGINLKAVPI